VVILDNVRFHRSARVQEMLAIRGFEWKYLPAYSPYFNPIECMFSQWKNYIKSARCANEVALQNEIDNFQVTPIQYLHYVDHVSHNALAYINGQRIFDN
jgi:transposase